MQVDGSTPAGDSIHPHFHSAKQRKNVTANIFSTLYSIFLRYVWRKGQEELVNYICYEFQEWNRQSRVWEIFDKLVGFFVPRFMSCSRKKCYHKGWQWPWLSKCGVICISLDIRFLSLSRCSKQHGGYMRNRPKLWSFQKCVMWKLGIFDIIHAQPQFINKHWTIFDWTFCFSWNWSNQPGNSPKNVLRRDFVKNNVWHHGQRWEQYILFVNASSQKRSAVSLEMQTAAKTMSQNWLRKQTFWLVISCQGIITMAWPFESRLKI